MNTTTRPMTGRPLPGVSRKIRKLLLARQEVAETIERLIAILDQIDGEADLEPAGDEEEDGTEGEPSLGWTTTEASYGVKPLAWSVDAELDDADAEPSLAAPESVSTSLGPSYPDRYSVGPRRTSEGRQTHWAAGDSQDLEGDPLEDDEAGGDDEPSLGWQHVIPGRVMVDGSAAWPDHE